jgi:hypothetical protein
MVDRYTKAVLTVIALALIGIVVSQAVPRANAFANCGAGPNGPCFIAVVDCRKSVYASMGYC